MHQRQKKILDMLASGTLSIHTAAERLGVTEMTIRRDLKELAAQKLVLEVRGGAISHPARYEPEFSENGLTERKLLLAETLARRILPADSLFIGTGSTTLAFAKVIARRNLLPMTVITHSLPVASALFRTCCKVILLGGELRTNSLDLVGPMAERNLAEYHVDWLVSGCDGALAEYGFYTSDMSLSHLEQMSIRLADHVAVITESGKFGQRALTRFASLDEIDLLVTDDGLEEADSRRLTESGIEVIAAAMP